ncbi:MAG TPA: hemolysin III family protein [Bacteroidota bacterium]|nr:hemolysin III family protein [Bacteroidota bacterium]
MPNETFTRARRFRIREPINGLTHAVGAVLAVVALIALVIPAASADKTRHVIAFAIYGTSLFLLYTSSALYHLLSVGEGTVNILRRVDHMMIYVLIAGTYTPICMIALRGTWGTVILVIIWSMACAGMIFSSLWLDAPRWLSTSLYVVMGWMAIVAIVPLVRALSIEGLLWLFGGGVFYSLGALMYGMKKPNPFPGKFGFHEIWHLCVLAGSACHFLVMERAILPMT